MSDLHQDTSQSTREPYLQVKNVTKTFGRFIALDNVTMDVAQGEFVCILGPSGCGKTTLLRVIAGLEQHNFGQIVQNGVDVSHLPPSKRDFGIVFQSYALFPNLTVAENVAYGLRNIRLPEPEIAAKVGRLLEMVSLGDLRDRYPAQLSGGQQQRVALARALALSPGLLLLDEPLSALDARVRAALRSEIAALQRRLGVTTVMVTHDQEEALSMADRIIVMKDGRIVQVGTPVETYQRPTTPFVADFVGLMNFLPGTMGRDRRYVHCGDTQLAVSEPDESLEPGSSVYIAIRPEEIVVLNELISDQNALMAEVEEVEFIGPFYRLKLQLDVQSPLRQRPALITYVSSSTGIGVAKGSQLPVYLPADRMRVYPANGKPAKNVMRAA